MRERVEAMKAIWTEDEAEYHGEHRGLRPDLVLAEAGAEAAPAGAGGRRRARRCSTACSPTATSGSRTGSRSPEELGGADRRAPAPSRGGRARADPGHGLRREAGGAAARAAAGDAGVDALRSSTSRRATPGEVERALDELRRGWRLSGTARRARPRRCRCRRRSTAERLEAAQAAADGAAARARRQAARLRGRLGPAAARRCSRAGTRPARAARSSGSSSRSTRATCAWRSSRAPTDDEKRHHFLWRFWPALPGLGGMTVFDRSWYGRVLVERVEELRDAASSGSAPTTTIVGLRAHRSAREGGVLVKFWLHVSRGGAAASASRSAETTR